MQAQSSATNKFMETTEEWSDVDSICNFETTKLISKAIMFTSRTTNYRTRDYEHVYD